MGPQFKDTQEKLRGARKRAEVQTAMGQTAEKGGRWKILPPNAGLLRPISAPRILPQPPKGRSLVGQIAHPTTKPTKNHQTPKLNRTSGNRPPKLPALSLWLPFQLTQNRKKRRRKNKHRHGRVPLLGRPGSDFPVLPDGIFEVSRACGSGTNEVLFLKFPGESPGEKHQFIQQRVQYQFVLKRKTGSVGNHLEGITRRETPGGKHLEKNNTS